IRRGLADFGGKRRYSIIASQAMPLPSGSRAATIDGSPSTPPAASYAFCASYHDPYASHDQAGALGSDDDVSSTGAAALSSTGAALPSTGTPALSSTGAAAP